MRAPPYVLSCAAWALLAGCVAAPEPKDWLALGFRTPEQTFRTFQTGLRAGLPDLEYRCLGTEFKAEKGLSQLAYREFRSELFASQPWLKLAAEAEVLAVRTLAPGRVRLVAEVDTWFTERTFAVELVREDFYEVWVGDARHTDDAARWRDLVRARGDEWQVSLPRPAGLELESVSELRAGREWKIAAFPLEGDDEEVP